MLHESDRAEPLTVPDLSPATFEAVADRLDKSSTFVELVYRESEMDALFTMADIAVKAQELGQVEHHLLSPETGETLRELRTLVFEAHDLTHDDEAGRAAAILRRAARVAARLG